VGERARAAEKERGAESKRTEQGCGKQLKKKPRGKRQRKDMWPGEYKPGGKAQRTRPNRKEES